MTLESKGKTSMKRDKKPIIYIGVVFDRPVDEYEIKRLGIVNIGIKTKTETVGYIPYVFYPVSFEGKRVIFACEDIKYNTVTKLTNKNILTVEKFTEFKMTGYDSDLKITEINHFNIVTEPKTIQTKLLLKLLRNPKPSNETGKQSYQIKTKYLKITLDVYTEQAGREQIMLSYEARNKLLDTIDLTFDSP